LKGRQRPRLPLWKLLLAWVAVLFSVSCFSSILIDWLIARLWI
jgi:hypothetical protein